MLWHAYSTCSRSFLLLCVWWAPPIESAPDKLSWTRADSRLAKVDEGCVASLRAERPAARDSRRFAVLLRGEGFRNWNFRGLNTTCCEGTRERQRDVLAQHEKMFASLEKLGYRVDVFISTYSCTNGKPYAQELRAWYAERLAGFWSAARGPESVQGLPFVRGLSMVSERVARTGERYAHVLLLRLDFLIATWAPDFCFTRAGRPLDFKSLCNQPNPDQMQYMPGEFLPCFNATIAPQFYRAEAPRREPGHAIMNELLAKSGEPQNASVLGDACAHHSGRGKHARCPLHGGKVTARDVWLRNGQNTQPRTGTCACASYVLADKAHGGPFPSGPGYLAMEKEFPIGGCSRYYSG